jgi:hypothetical protein
MFGLFLDDVFKNFWGNSIGDIFLSQTCAKLEMNLSSVDLVYYAGLKAKPAHYAFDVNKNLVIQNQIITPTQFPSLDENDNPILDVNGDPTYYNEDVITYETASTINADMYCAKGLSVKVC